jgi:iron-sulfur cluster assembly accessory protein
MVEITEDAIKFIKELLEKNDKTGYGVRIYLAGMSCSGPQFGMAFQEKKEEDELEQEVDGFSFYYEGEVKDILDQCTVEYVDGPEGTGLIIHNPNVTACSSCSGCH